MSGGRFSGGGLLAGGNLLPGGLLPASMVAVGQLPAAVWLRAVGRKLRRPVQRATPPVSCMPPSFSLRRPIWADAAHKSRSGWIAPTAGARWCVSG